MGMGIDGHETLTGRFEALDGADPAVRLILGLDRLLLAPKIRAHPTSMAAHLEGGTREGRRRLLDVAFGLTAMNSSGSSIMGRWLRACACGSCRIAAIRGIAGARIPDMRGVRGTETPLGRLAVFAMDHGGWAEDMIGIVDGAWADAGRGPDRTACLAGMLSAVFGRRPSAPQETDPARPSPEDVCAGMILGIRPFSGWGMIGALTAMGMDRPPDVARVSDMIGFLTDGMADDMRLAAVTGPAAAGGADGIMAVRRRAKSEMEDAGVVEPDRDFQLCGWRTLRALADGTLPPRLADSMLADQRCGHGRDDVIRERDRMLACDRMAAMDFSSPDPERMESILRTAIPAMAAGAGTTVEDVISCSLHDDRKVIYETGGAGGDVAYRCAVDGDAQGLAAVNALWDLLHAAAPYMVGRNNGTGGGVRCLDWPILAGSAVSAAIRDFASRSLPDGFIAETLAAAPRGKGPACAIDVRPCRIHGCKGDDQYSIAIDWSH